MALCLTSNQIFHLCNCTCYRRWIFCCCTCCCNLCKPSADPMKYIADRGMTATKVTAILMALGVVASGIYGMVEAGPHLVNETVGTIGSLTASHLHGFVFEAHICTWLLDECIHCDANQLCTCTSRLISFRERTNK